MLRSDLLSVPTVRRALAAPISRFLAIGVLSTLAYALLYLALADPLGSGLANDVALAVTAVANTTANRRLTFGIRGRERMVRHQVAAFAVGFRLHGSALDGLAAFGLVVAFGFAFEWLFVTMGLFAANAQAAQAMGMIVFPFAFISSAYIPVATMPSWLQVFASHQPLTYMVDAVRALTLGPHAQALLGHPAGYFTARASIWAVAIMVVSLPVAVAKYRRG